MMILDRDVNPERQIYYLGSVILKIAREKGRPFVGLQEACDSFVKETSSGSEVFFLALDWVYCLGAVEVDERGAIRCSSEV